ncbi:kinesin-like protein, putative, partial [Bodo saltans]
HYRMPVWPSPFCMCDLPLRRLPQGPLITMLAERAMKSIRDILDVRDVRFHLSCVEAYDKDIIDLMRGANAADRKLASGRTWTAVSNVTDLHEHVGKANRRRKTSATDHNATSSRSHMIVILRCEFVDTTDTPRLADLNLVDLAGSEKVSTQTAAAGDRLRETKAINTSLSSLASLFRDMVEQGAAFVVSNKHTQGNPLIKVLKESLTGRSHLSLILCVVPSMEHQKYASSTLEFGALCLKLKLAGEALQLQHSSSSCTCVELKATVERLKEELHNAHRDLDDFQMILDGGDAANGTIGGCHVQLKAAQPALRYQVPIDQLIRLLPAHDASLIHYQQIRDALRVGDEKYDMLLSFVNQAEDDDIMLEAILTIMHIMSSDQLKQSKHISTIVDAIARIAAPPRMQQ